MARGCECGCFVPQVRSGFGHVLGWEVWKGGGTSDRQNHKFALTLVESEIIFEGCGQQQTSPQTTNMSRFNTLESLESRKMFSASLAGLHHHHELAKHSETPQLTMPAKPTGLSAQVSGKTVQLHWTDASSNETGFVIERYTGGKTGLVDIGTVGPNVTTFSDNSPMTGYDAYIVRAVNSAGRSEGSNSVVVKLGEPAPIVHVIAPNHLSTVAVSTTQIAIGWSGDAGATGGYRIERCLYGATNWTVAGTTAAGVREFLDSGLAAHTKYLYRIVAINADGPTATSAVGFGMTKSGDSTRA
jgi:hypothetical protein